MNDVDNQLPAKQKLLGLQVLRAVASIMVMIAHAAAEAEHYFALSSPFSFVPLTKGVDLFFVISGFIIYHSSSKLLNLENPLLTFVKNRFYRVVPLYFLYTTAIVGVLLVFPQGLKETKFDFWQIITSYLFVPYARYDGRVAPVLSLGWTLNYEVYFYALFAFCMYWQRKHLAPVAAGLLVLLSVAGTFIPDSAPTAFQVWTKSIIIEFAFGILIAWAYERNAVTIKKSGIAVAILLFFGFSGLYLLNVPDQAIALPRFISAGFPSAVIVAAVVLFLPEHLESRLSGLLVSLGDSSYSLYLSHRFVLRPVQLVVVKLFAVGSYLGWLYVALASVIALIIGHMSFLILEKPILNYFKSRTGGSRN